MDSVPISKRLVRAFQDIPEGSDAVLLIGNDALTAHEKLKKSGAVVTILRKNGKMTSLFCFCGLGRPTRGLFKTPKRGFEVYQALLKSKRWEKNIRKKL